MTRKERKLRKGSSRILMFSTKKKTKSNVIIDLNRLGTVNCCGISKTR